MLSISHPTPIEQASLIGQGLLSCCVQMRPQMTSQILTTVLYAATTIQSELAQNIKPIYHLCSREVHEPSSRLLLERSLRF